MTRSEQLSAALGPRVCPPLGMEKKASAMLPSVRLAVCLQATGLEKQALLGGLRLAGQGLRAAIGYGAHTLGKAPKLLAGPGKFLLGKGDRIINTTTKVVRPVGPAGATGQFLTNLSTKGQGLSNWGRGQVMGARHAYDISKANRLAAAAAKSQEIAAAAGKATSKAMEVAARGKTWFRAGAGGFFGNSRASRFFNMANIGGAAGMGLMGADRKRELDNVSAYSAAKTLQAIQNKPWYSRLAMGFSPEMTASEVAKTNPQAANYLRYLNSQNQQPGLLGNFWNVFKPQQNS